MNDSTISLVRQYYEYTPNRPLKINEIMLIFKVSRLKFYPDQYKLLPSDLKTQFSIKKEEEIEFK